LDGDQATGEDRSTAPPPRSAARRVARGVVLVLAAIVATIFDEAIFSTPIVLATGAFGAGTASVAFFVLYSIGGAVVSIVIARRYDRRLAGGPGRLERWLAMPEDDRRVQWARRLLDRGGFLAFLVSSVLLGPIVTTLLVRAMRRDQGLRAVGTSSSVLWAAGFVATYAGIAQLVL
jgi:hypothetical protein